MTGQAGIERDRARSDPRSPSQGWPLDIVIDVPLRATVEIGSARMLVKEVLQLAKGSVIPLDRMSGDPADILVNGRLIARGELTMVDGRLAIRVIELLTRDVRGGTRG